MKYNNLKFSSLLTVLLVCLSFSISAQPTADAGKALFKANCAQCHAKNMKTDATGPALGGAQERWGDDEALYSWIRNSGAMIASGHPRAVELWNTWKPANMTAYPNLTDDEIGSLIMYINGMYEGTYGVVAGAAVAADTGAGNEKESNGWLYAVLLGVLGLLAIILTRIINNLDVLAAAKDGREIQKKSLFESLTSKGIVSTLIFGLVIFAGYTTVNNAVSLGRQQGYQPDQPIKFSHATHAGIHKIECQYCHDGARRSKHSVIPAANTCMNCHKAIKVGSNYGTAELTKIYASVGYDPTTNKYLEDYENIPEEEYKAIYTKWIGDEYIKANDLTALDSEAEREVEAQWTALKKSLTNEQKKKVQGPIEWIRIHNLPDHVYFNHAQHVTVGKVECQTCHGAVEEMEVVAQHSPLSMGWCINCHRQTGVQFNDNEYYASYADYHEELKSGARDKVTVADIGGLECQKCHY